MVDESEVQRVGEWWHADAPSTRLPGVLDRDLSQGQWLLRVLRVGSMADDAPRGLVETGKTLYGDTSDGPVTLFGANRWSQTEHSQLTDGEPSSQTTETWHAFRALIGGHFDADTRWEAITIELPLTWEWMSPTALEPHAGRVLTKDLSEEIECNLGSLRLVLRRYANSRVGRRALETSGHACYVFTHTDGVTMGDVARPVLALENLHRVLFGEHVRSDTWGLYGPFGARRAARFSDVSGAQTVEPVAGLHEPYLSTDDVDFSKFVPRWIQLHADAPVWPVLGPPEGGSGWVHTQTLEAVSALESLAREHLALENPRTGMHDEIREATQSLSSSTRRHVEFLLKFDGPSLADRLAHSADLLGTASASWLLGDDPSDWARVVARVRNFIAHGVRSPSGLDQEPAVVLAVRDSVQVIYQLALLRLAGYDNGQGVEYPELLVDTSGAKLIRHPDSRLAHNISDVRRFRDEWRIWEHELSRR